MESSDLFSVLAILAIVIVVSLVLREGICWYWKINERVALLEEIRNLLAKNSNSGDKYDNEVKALIDKLEKNDPNRWGL
jgi:hypothetical protein